MTTANTACPELFPLLDEVCGPKALRDLPPGMLTALAAEIRAFLLAKVTAVGGHLGPNLGTVELTLALHRVFDSPHDTLLFDTGHQAYVHKILTGRAAGFGSLRQAGGLSGYPSRAESVHDVIENSHASTALGYADGLAKARQLAGEGDRAVVAVVGDGALTGGMAWEALNNLGAAPDRPVIVVLNDNARSYAPTVGALAHHLRRLRVEVRGSGGGCPGAPAPGRGAIGPLPAARTLFELLGFAYLGPVDGHHIPALEETLCIARDLRMPAVVHVVTVKGKGYAPAEGDLAECMHAVGVIDPQTGRPAQAAAVPTWTQVFAGELCALGERHEDVVAITAAMPGPTGLARFQRRFPDRCFDVGIAEQHAVTSAAGLAMGGLHPVVAVYATFLNRAIDQVLMDVALHRLPVTFVLDRAGITGPDGPSHHGMWDLTFLGAVPGLRVAAPRDAAQLRELLAEAVADTSGPTALRFPKASVGADLPALRRHGVVDILHRTGDRDVLLVGIGPLAGAACTAAADLAAHGIGVTVVDPRWVLPVPAELTDLAAGHRLVATVEDNTRCGGIGAAVTRALADAGATVPVQVLALPGHFLPHGSRAGILAAAGLTTDGITQRVLGAVNSPPALAEAPVTPAKRPV
ncbi:1-deoxy-D-xylulose-5-phosphate synthase [Streptomyces sp. MNP-20]|uniref:1-deoxy-D-xylulose-5-phosphate synthase n=1 Tax=Streptomyces sp. MNP-20 TaxID=2721165 RepID=UPI001553FD99|nr:1-deoxy-D-xylulose-5-phosphate synthase [Streptomyces sp. MNP-20]